MLKYAKLAVANTTTAIWWNSRMPRGLCDIALMLSMRKTQGGRATHHEIEADDEAQRGEHEDERDPEPVVSMNAEVKSDVEEAGVVDLLSHRCRAARASDGREDGGKRQMASGGEVDGGRGWTG